MLSESMKIIVKLESNNIIKGKVDAASLGNFLIYFQMLLDKILFTKIDKKKIIPRDISRLYLKEIKEGSLDLIFEPSPQTTIDNVHLLESSYNELINLSEDLTQSPENARIRILKYVEDPKLRLSLEVSLKNLLESDFNISFYKIKSESLVRLDSSKIEYIKQWINEDQKTGAIKLKGVIVRIKGDEPERSFTVLDENNKIIKCFYKSDLEKNVVEYFKIPVEISGIAYRKVRGTSIDEILDIKPWKFEETNKLYTLKLKDNVKINIDFEEDIWCLSISELSVNGCGYTYKEALKDLEENIINSFEIYVKKFDENSLSEDAKKLRNNLIKFVGLDNYENLQKKRTD
jgi:hypothetical protein